MKKIFEKVYTDSMNSFLQVVKDSLCNEKRMFIVTANPETFTLGENRKDYYALLEDDVTTICPDGIGIIKAMDYLGIHAKERIPGVAICEKLFEYGNTYNKSVCILGSKQEVLDKLTVVLKKNYPNLKLSSLVNGYVSDKDAVMEEFKALKPDIVIVALGIPNQELLIYKHLKDFDKGIFVGVGGSLDVISGSKKRAPEIFIKLNLEWFYRIASEPSRIKRFYNNNVKFLFSLKKYK